MAVHERVIVLLLLLGCSCKAQLKPGFQVKTPQVPAGYQNGLGAPQVVAASYQVGVGGPKVASTGFQVGVGAPQVASTGYQVGVVAPQVASTGFQVGVGGPQVASTGFQVGVGGPQVASTGFQVGVGGPQVASTGYQVGVGAPQVASTGYQVGAGGPKVLATGYQVGAGAPQVASTGYQVGAGGPKVSATGYQMTADALVYSFALVYTPRGINGLPIVRTNGAMVGIECHYLRKQNVSSNALVPTWVPYYATMAAEAQLSFSLRLMDDAWQNERASNVYFLGSVLNIEASVLVGNSQPLRVFVDSCVATLVPDVSSVPSYAFVQNSG
ncbi:uncharacterized protein [Paramormyrops kingsleyae]|uniref:uncharacterized protein isoform X6 n=1 Tax=Paramormyrops kingsleyae TaxID=1676925 RepID=UPI003B97820C